jgi:carbonic anhydrase/acetyltransferase-like protein (isoleucine patch superfamily)
VTIGHSVVLNEYTVDDCCLIAMGAMVLKGMIIAGVPEKIKQPLMKEEKQFLHQSAANDVLYRDSDRS